MERNRKGKGRVLESVAELFDLPADVVRAFRGWSWWETGSCIWSITQEF